MKSLPLALIAVALLSACVHQAVVHKAPDAGPLLEHNRKLAAEVASAKIAIGQAKQSLAGSQKSEDAAKALFDIIEPKLDELSLDSPADFKLALASIHQDMESLRVLINDVGAEDGAARGFLSSAETHLETATAEKNLVTEATAQYVAASDRNTKAWNETETKWAADSKALAWYRLHWWGSWIALGVGAILFVLLGVAKFVNRNR